MAERIRIDGLRDFQRQLKGMDTALPRQLRLALNEASRIVIDYAEKGFPRKTGRAAGSLKARSSQRVARVALGGRRAPYAPWIDFGGRVGRNRSVVRPFIKDGRYVYKGLAVKRGEITDVLAAGLAQLARDAGLEVG